jgi:iron(III) transport system ATP-binding protein
MPELIVEALTKRFGSVEVLKGVSVELSRGEVIALLGPSGSGKTTLLRAVAGLERPDGGRIMLGERIVFDGERRLEVPAEERGLGLVFQSYALWPHRTVFENVAYGLRLRRVPDGEVRQRVEDVLARLNLAPLGQRYPHQLSGGQQQRVALARAIVYNPPILLLDEPLSNLDAKLREEARAWFRELILKLQLSALYVTHDQVEALSVADRILLLQGGVIEQAGTPAEMYDTPRTLFTAEFMGSNDRLPGTIAGVDGRRALLRGDDWQVQGTLRASKQTGDDAVGLIRLERVRLEPGSSDGITAQPFAVEPDAAHDGANGVNRLRLPLEAALFVGERWEYVFALGSLRLRAWSVERLPPGEHWVTLPADSLWIF